MCAFGQLPTVQTARPLPVMIADWSPPVLAAALLVSLGAGVVRGFSGFGYSALTVAGLSIIVTPSTLVPAVLSLEVLASISMWRGTTLDVSRGWLLWLLLCNLLFVPLGVLLLAVLPEDWLRLVVAVTLLTSALALWRLSEHALRDTPLLRLAAGVASGVMNGVAASGGVVAAMLMAASRSPAAAMRATMVSFVMFSSVYTVACAALVPLGTSRGTPLLSIDTLRWALLLAPSMLLGIWLGRRSFQQADPQRYRRFVLLLLIVISALGLLRSIVALWWT